MFGAFLVRSPPWFLAGFFVNLELTSSSGLAGHRASGIHLSPSLQRLGYKCTPQHPALSVCVGDLNSDFEA